MRRKLGSIFLALSLLLTVFVAGGCQKKANNSSTSTSGTSTSSTSGAPTQLTIAFLTFGNPPADLTAVENALSDITKKEINATVKLVPIGIANYSQQINLMLTSNEPLDIFVTGNLGNVLQYNIQAPEGKLLPIDSLVDQYGQGIKSSLGSFLDAAKVNGKLYGVPTLRDMGQNNDMFFNKNLVDKYHIDLSKIKVATNTDELYETISEIEAALKQFHQADPSVAPYGYGNGLTFIEEFGTVFGDPLGDTSRYGVLLDSQKLDVSDYYTSDEYKKLVGISREWYTSGLIDKDTVTSTQNIENFVKTGQVFSYSMAAKPGVLQQEESNAGGTPLVAVPFFTPHANTQTVTDFMLGIPSYAKHPDVAMKMLNLMYTNKDVINMLSWGIEGKNYVKVSGSDNMITFPSGVTATNEGWVINNGFEFGNTLISYIWQGNPTTLNDDMKKFNDSAIKSKALGFTFDGTKYQTQTTALANVTKQYKQQLENGIVDPATTLPAYQKALNAAGLQTIIQAKAEQLKDWASKNQ